ncbi:hypothetical protein CKO40_22840 [Halochromatium glycolicum]|uniref:Uncharacterized protein n=1 Tax=Halochromatium glycolicum TaxID=85075 RepID=A0AAJ0U8H9_9GAMM|nr:hypothetical protein [Halochromatium glycolicum]
MYGDDLGTGGGRWLRCPPLASGHHLLVAGDKAGTAQKRFYKQLVRKADERFDAHLKRLTAENGGKR